MYPIEQNQQHVPRLYVYKHTTVISKTNNQMVFYLVYYKITRRRVSTVVEHSYIDIKSLIHAGVMVLS